MSRRKEVPPTFSGFGPNLQTPEDLFAKLRRDLERMMANPWSEDATFDFFVTAGVLHEWHQGDPQRRAVERDGEPVLALCHHLANGAKHFEVTHGKKRPVGGVERRRGFSAAFNDGFQRPDLVVRLGDVRLEHAPGAAAITARELAEVVVEEWGRRLDGTASGA